MIISLNEFVDQSIDYRRYQILNNLLNEAEYYIENDINIIYEGTGNKEIITRFYSGVKETRDEIKAAKKCIKQDHDTKAAKKHYEKAIDLLNKLDKDLRLIDDISMNTNLISHVILLVIQIPKILVQTFISEKIVDANFKKFEKDVNNIEGNYVKFNVSDIEKTSKYKIGNIPIGSKHYKSKVNIDIKPGTVNGPEQKLAADMEAQAKYKSEYIKKLKDHDKRANILKAVNLLNTGISVYKSIKKQSDLYVDDMNRDVSIKNNNSMVRQLRLYIMDIKKYIVKQMDNL